ncbi:MAG: chemotaxis protein CheW [Synergistaceae bacterium]|nr:chemotaxis protein CheW [Synergistota bacterium]NLM71847.1 chemotaxis protein CheW [Synergistaceae bacterium]
MAEQQLVVFGLGNEEFGIDISSVMEIVKIQHITTVPQSMDFVEGIVNLRGVIVPIVDLNKKFMTAMHSNSDDAEMRIIVVHMAGQNIGIMVDAVSEILRVPDEAIEPTPPIVSSGISSDFIKGVAKVDDRLIIFLDLDRIFSAEEQEALASTAQ